MKEKKLTSLERSQMMCLMLLPPPIYRKKYAKSKMKKQISFMSLIKPPCKNNKTKQNRMIQLLMFLALIGNVRKSNTTFRHRLLPNEYIYPFEGKDVYSQFCNREFDFFGITGETLDSFQQMYWLLMRVLATNRQRMRSPILISWKNKLLMTLIWLRSYPTFQKLSLMFDVSLTCIHKTVHEIWPILHHTFKSLISWPAVNEWQNLRGTWPELEEAVGCIDGTSHRIYRPKENQGLFYSGHRHMHCVHTQVIIDCNKEIRYLKSGFLGHNNDAMTYRLMDDIGPNGTLQFPQNCILLGDTIYPSEHPIVTPYTLTQLLAQDVDTRQQSKNVNKLIRSRRVYVEHSIREVKVYKIISSLYRHDRNDIAPIVELCAALTLRKCIV